MDMEHIKALFFHPSLPSVVMCLTLLVTGVLLMQLSAPALCFKGYYTYLCQQISLKLFASIRGTHWCSHQYYQCHVDAHKGLLITERCTTYSAWQSTCLGAVCLSCHIFPF
jgi:hypothetical protein